MISLDTILPISTDLYVSSTLQLVQTTAILALLDRPAAFAQLDTKTQELHAQSSLLPLCQTVMSTTEVPAPIALVIISWIQQRISALVSTSNKSVTIYS